jgi:HAE1 family hydrophobic/amphiphilic exporter-1
MTLTQYSVERPVATLMACLAVVILGVVALRKLAVDLMPEMEYPTVSVTTLYNGAGPAEIETLITRPMEQTLSSVRGVDRISSTSTEGSSTVRIQFNWGVNLDSAVSDIRDAIQRIRKQLPQQIEEPSIRHFDVADQPILYLGISSELDPIPLTRLAEQQIAPQLERVDGVARVSLRGSVRREIQISLNRTKLEALDMGVSEVVDILARENSSQPAGDFQQGPFKLLVRSHGEFTSLQEIEDTVVRERNGAVVRIRDVAEVIDGEEERTELSRIDGRPAIMVYIFKQAGANTIEVSNGVHAAVEHLNGTLRDAQLKIRIDKSDFIRSAIANVKHSALSGMGLAVLVLIVFLGSFRSTLVVAVSMPLSLLATFVMIYFKGFTLNIVSFGGLAMGVGMLVDSSIVVLESIFLKREQGLDPVTAAVEGTREVTTAVVAGALSTMIVFIPLIFITGVTGVLLQQLAWVVCFSNVCVLAFSLTLTPMLTTWWRDRPKGAANPSETELAAVEDGGNAVPQIAPQRGASGFFQRSTDAMHSANKAMIGGLESLYARVLRFSLRHAGSTAAVLLLTVSASFGLIPRIGTEFLPKTDEGDLNIDASMEPGIQLGVLDTHARRIEEAVRASVPELSTLAVFVGDRPEAGDQWHKSRFRVKLSPRAERERGIEDVRRDLATKIGDLPGMKLRVSAQSSSGMMGMLASGSSGGMVAVQVRGHDLKTSGELTAAVKTAMQRVGGLANVDIARQERRSELAARVDRTKASLIGVTVKDISQTLETTLRGTEATIYREQGDEFNVLVRLREEDRNRLDDVEQVGIALPSRQVVAMKNFVSFSTGQAPVSINRMDQQRYNVVTGEADGRDLGHIVADLKTELASIPLPDGFSLTISGDWEEQQRSFGMLTEGLLLAVVLMYMAMAAQFESFRDPMLIMISVPLGAVGVVVMLLMTGTTLNVQSFIGLIMLAGIVVNNAIVLVDYFNQLRQEEPTLTVDELLVKSGARRLRPILMTTATTVLAMIPVALGWGDGGELEAPMARVVIGGLTSGTIITLIAIPLLLKACTRKSAVPSGVR